MSRTASRPPLWSSLEAWLGHGSYLSPLASPSITGSSEVGLVGVFLGTGEAALEPWLCLFCAHSGQDLPPGWNSGSPVPCRWVEEFLNEENRGLDVLLEYLAFAQCSVT